MKSLLTEKINHSGWWHVPPKDPNAYQKRGKFLASTFLQAEFYGRPNDEPEKVCIQNPIFGFSELEILEKLFEEKGKKYLERVVNESGDFYKRRIDLDAKMHDRAKGLGHDAIILMTPFGKKSLLKNRKPHSIELNLIV